MDKYNNYLWSYIASGCERMGEDRDYPGYLTFMEQAVSIDKLVQIYNNIYKLLAVIILDSYDLPENWYKTNCLGLGNTCLFNELDLYFNENVLRLFNKLQTPTLEQCLTYLANLRGITGVYKIQNKIKQKTNADNISKLERLITIREDQYKERKKIEKGIRDSSLKKYKDYSKILASYNRVFDVAEVLFGESYDFNYEQLLEEYNQEIEQTAQLALLKEEREREEKGETEKRSFNIWIILIPIIIIVVLILVFSYINPFILLGFIGLVLSGQIFKMK